MTHRPFPYRTATAGLLTLALIAGTFAGCGEDHCGAWAEGANRGGMTLRYNGYGQARACHDSRKWTWQLSPVAASAPNETHAALASAAAPVGDLRIRVRIRTPHQLRETAPQPWEVGWLIWRYTDDQHFYYLVLKSNGLEIGKEDPAYPGAQRFLFTDKSRHYDVTDWHDVEVRQVADRITVAIDDTTRAVARDRERPYLNGDVGLYTEDAVAHFTALHVTRRLSSMRGIPP